MVGRGGDPHMMLRLGCISSAIKISVWSERLCQNGRAPSQTSDIPQWWITPHLASIPRIASHVALRSLFHHIFFLCRSPIPNQHAGIVANCDDTSELVHWVCACMGMAIRWAMLQKSLVAFLRPVPQIQFSPY